MADYCDARIKKNNIASRSSRAIMIWGASPLIDNRQHYVYRERGWGDMITSIIEASPETDRTTELSRGDKANIFPGKFVIYRIKRCVSKAVDQFMTH